MKLKLGRDAAGRPRATADDGALRERLVGRFLELDVVDSNHARNLLRAARRTSGPSHRSSGNAYEISVGPRRTTITAQIEPRSGPGSVALPTREFRTLLENWLPLLEDLDGRPDHR